MGKLLDDPTYPVIERAPGFWQTVGNFSLNDYAVFAGLTGISLPLGYAAGAQPSPAFAKVSGAMARPSMVTAGLIGAVAGFLLAYQNSAGRLMGFKPNEAEVRAAKL